MLRLRGSIREDQVAVDVVNNRALFQLSGDEIRQIEDRVVSPKNVLMAVKKFFHGQRIMLQNTISRVRQLMP